MFACINVCQVMSIIGNIVGYMIRFSLSVAMLDMTNKSNSTVPKNGSCVVNSTLEMENYQFSNFEPSGSLVDQSLNKSGATFDWTPEQQAQIIACFFYGYTIGVGPLGATADLLGARWVIGLSVGLSGVLGLFYELFAHWGYGWFCALRFFQGLVQAGMFPPQTSMWGRWAPRKERTILLGLSNAVAILGNILGNILTALICETIGWPWVFYIFGSMGIIWSIFWILYYRNSPSEMNWIEPEELEYIQADLGQLNKDQGDSKVQLSQIPWTSIFTSLPF